MKPKYRKLAIALMMTITITLSGAVNLLRADTGTCNGTSFTLPFTDVAGNGLFCQIAAAYFSGLTNGTTPTTYSPNDAVPRSQMAAFVTRTLDQSVKRSSKRAALNQWWTPKTVTDANVFDLGGDPHHVTSNGRLVYAASSDGNVVRSYLVGGGLTGVQWKVPKPKAVLVAGGYLWVTGTDNGTAKLYRLNLNATNDPAPTCSLPAPCGVCPPQFQIPPPNPYGCGADCFPYSTQYNDPRGLAFDGQRIWIAFGGGAMGILDLKNGSQLSYANTGFVSPRGVLFDGNSIWVTDDDNTLKRLNPSGGIDKVVPVISPKHPVFDGANLWVPAQNSVVVVRALTGNIVATLTGNGLSTPVRAAFDGERVLVTNLGDDSINLYKAMDLTFLGNVEVGQNPFGACSDGVNFWVTLKGTGKIARL
jgi:hypothetical protein